MTSITQSQAWQALRAQQQELAKWHMRDLFAADPARFDHFSLHGAGLLLDYSKNCITAETMQLLCQLAETAQLPEKIALLLSGHPVNTSENRAALHTALRHLDDTAAIYIDGKNIITDIRAKHNKMREFVNAIWQQEWRGFSNEPITDIVNIGIGGSDLGPALAVDALKPYITSRIRCHFISNIDGTHISQVLKNLNPAHTLFIISSKNFSTQETLFNAQTAKEWLLKNAPNADAIKQHFIAITAKAERAQQFGVARENIFPLWDWIGGRFSLWSAVGLPIALAIGYENFQQILAGAAAMDEHFRAAPLAQNMPVILALLSIWYINFFNAHSHAILPYKQNLHLLPAYLQQAHMESLGKQVRHNNIPVDYDTGCVIWGGAGTNGQHTFHQLLHQGTHFIPADFIIAREAHYSLQQHHTALFANCLSQSQALMCGKNYAEAYAELIATGHSKAEAEALAPHKVIPGNRPSNTIVLPKLTPYSFGALIALYEHKIFTQSVIWDINCFDQWGVELGKQLAHQILEDLENNEISHKYDGSTRGLLEYFYGSKRELA